MSSNTVLATKKANHNSRANCHAPDKKLSVFVKFNTGYSLIAPCSDQAIAGGDLSIMSALSGSVISVSKSADHRFSKDVLSQIRLVCGMGVAGDAHFGKTVQHLSRVRVDPTQPNLRQVHLLQGELLAELSDSGFSVQPGDLGENILTKGLDLLALPRSTILHLGASARIEITGLRNPCYQIDAFQDGLLSRVLVRTDDGTLIRRAGVMGIVLEGGIVRRGDGIRVVLPEKPHRKLERV